MKRHRLIAALGFAMIAGCAQGATFSNGDFETGSLSPWFQGTNGSTGFYTGSPWTVSSAAAHSGLYGAVADGNQQMEQTFDGISTDKIARFSLWMERPNITTISTSNNGVLVHFYYSDNTSNSVVGRLTDNGWDYFDFTSSIKPGKTLVGVDTWGYVESTGSKFITYVDDVALVTTPEPGSLTMMSMGLLGAGLFARRRKIARASQKR